MISNLDSDVATKAKPFGGGMKSKKVNNFVD